VVLSALPFYCVIKCHSPSEPERRLCLKTSTLGLLVGASVQQEDLCRALWFEPHQTLLVDLRSQQGKKLQKKR